jgi:hypothetical protein
MGTIKPPVGRRHRLGQDADYRFEAAGHPRGTSRDHQVHPGVKRKTARPWSAVRNPSPATGRASLGGDGEVDAMTEPAGRRYRNGGSNVE